MRASTRRCRLTFSRQQSHRTTRRTVFPLAAFVASTGEPGTCAGRPSIDSHAGFQPVSSHSGQGMSVEMAAKLNRLPQLAFGARLNLPDALARQVQPIADFLQGPRL